MAKARIRMGEHGFSLVELLVALVFTMVLMAGMANVYKSSLSTFYTSGETLSNLRRNRMSVDLLVDDLNTACMYIADLPGMPTVSPTVPPFFILPNMPIAGAGAGDPATCDELYFYVDVPLPFQGTLDPAVAAQKSGNEAANENYRPTLVGDRTFVIECGSPTYANQVGVGQHFIFKDFWEVGYINSATPSGSTVTLVAGESTNVRVTGIGSTGLPNQKHIPGSGIVFFRARQMVRYRIEMLNLDPSKPGGIPCLVRDQGPYNPAGFAPVEPQQIVAENVDGFKVYLSTNAGTSWAGMGGTYSGFASGWNGGIRAALDTQLAASGRPEFKSTRSTEHWFRSIPTLVRADVTTRTATQRAEYSDTGAVAAYKKLTQSLVFVPRHSGLTLN